VGRVQVNLNVIRANLSLRFYQLLKSVLKKHKIDVVLIEGCWIAPISALAAKSLGIPSILHLISVESAPEHGLNPLNRIIARFTEYVGVKFSTKTLMVSNEDRKTLLRRGFPSHKLEVLPNPVDQSKYDGLTKKEMTEARMSLGIEKRDPVILFVGGLDYPPNRLAVKRIFEEIAPRVVTHFPNAKFCVIGPHPPLEYSHPSIIYTGGIYGRELAPFIATADVGIAPIEWGTGTKMKILEYFAAGLAVVSTSAGAKGLDVQDGNNILIADDYKDFSRKIVELLNDGKKRKQLGSNALRLVMSSYRREVVVKKLTTMLERFAFKK
jgi:glycosyltransferase involved in cell wall biosynthesis